MILALAVTGAYASINRINSPVATTVVDDGVTTASIADGAVTTSKLHDEALNDITKQGGFSKLGVGTASPAAALEVEGIGSETNLILTGAQKFYGTGTLDNAGTWAVGNREFLGGSLDFSIYDVASGREPFMIDQPTGNVGIGTVSPGSALDVVGETRIGADATKSTMTATGHGQFQAACVGAGCSNTDTRFSVKAAESDAFAVQVSSQNGDALLQVDKYGHLYSSGTAPSASSGTMDERSTDVVMFHEAATSTSDITFAEPWDSAPACVAAGQAHNLITNMSTTGFTLTNLAAGQKTSVICMGLR